MTLCVLLAYGAVYHLLPLLGGLVLYAVLEKYASAHSGSKVKQVSAKAPRINKL